MATVTNIPPGWGWLGGLLHIGFFLLVVFHCLQHRREATSALLWMAVAWSVPFLGPLLFVLFGVDRVHVKGFRKKMADDALLVQRRARESENLPLAYWRAVHEAVRTNPSTPMTQDLDRMMDAVLPEHFLLGGNAIEPLVCGDEAYPVMRDAIRQARHHVHVQSFIIGDDAVGREFMDLLAERARAGVTVRILYDRFGCTRAILTGFFRRYARCPNLRIAGWTQADPLKRQFQINLRNHRKILVVDGTRAFCGGINIHQDNVKTPGADAIRDYHFDIRGPLVQELQYSFMRDWYFITEEEPANLLHEHYFPHVPPAGPALARLINSGPSGELEAIADVFFGAILTARHQLTIVTPYFVPTSDILRAIRAASLRGVEVRIILPEINNHIYAGLASRALYEPLMQAGIRIYERQPPFMHAKAMLVDDELVIVGTANMDVRSLRLNYETCMAVFDAGFVDKMKRIVLEDLARSREIVPAVWKQRPLHRRLAENFCSLLTPML